MSALIQGGDRVNSRAVRWLFGLAAAAAFGPYLVAGPYLAGVRTDQFVIYAVVATSLALAPWLWLRRSATGVHLGLMVAWITYFAVATVGVLFPLAASQLRWAPGSVLSGADNLALPLAVLLMAFMYVRPSNRDRVLGTVCKVVVVLSVANAVVSLFMTKLNLAPYLRIFWVGDTSGTTPTVAEMAAELGRFAGVFGQPAEAGIMYGLGGLCAVYLWSDRPSRLYPSLLLIFAGGFLSVSKIFLLGAAPIILWQVWRARRGRVGGVFVLTVAALAFLQTSYAAQWTGLQYLTRLLHPAQGQYLDLYTANRFGSTSGVGAVFDEVLSVSPLIGYGMGGVRVPYDNGLVEAMVSAGLLGAVLYIVILILLGTIASQLAGSQRRLAWGLAVFAAGASLGIPVLTTNRSGTILWLLIGVLATRQRPIDHQPIMPAASHQTVSSDETVCLEPKQIDILDGLY